MDAEYAWILIQGENCRQSNLLTWNSFISQFVHPVGEEGMGYRCWMRYIVILARTKFHFIIVHDNLVQDPSNNKSIIVCKSVEYVNVD